jgi:crossover junction endodeoxyribonuclease RuvC
LLADKTRVIGIDPGSRHTGYGIIDIAAGRVTHVDNGAISPNPKKPFAERLAYIYDGLEEVLARFNPTEGAIEEIFFARNVKSAIKLGEARGTAILAMARFGIPVSEYAATAVKQAVTGFGRAEKCQVAAMTATLLKLPEPACADAADALAVALCHSNNRCWQKKLQESETKKARVVRSRR